MAGEKIIGQPEQMTVDLSQVKNVRCVCGNEYWKQVFILKKLSAIQSPTGHEAITTVPGFLCSNCGLPVEKALKGK